MSEVAGKENIGTKETVNFDLETIKEMIPHRYPMLMVDKVIDVVRGESATGIKCITNTESYFQGHFPKKPVMPGVLIIEAMAQTAAIVVIDSLDIPSAGDLVYFMSIDSARFRRPVYPGDKLELHVKMIQSRKNVWKFEGRAIVDGNLHANAVYTAMIMEEIVK